MVNLGFFTSHTSGEIKKVIIEDVERIEKFLAHQIPDITSALCVPIIVFIYLLTVNVPMALCLLAPVVLGLVIQGIATVATGRQMPEYHRLQGKLNSTIMQFINGMPVMKTYNMTAESYKEYSDTVTEYNSFWKRCTRDQGYTYGVFVALVESGILFALPVGGLLYFGGSLAVQDYDFFLPGLVIDAIENRRGTYLAAWAKEIVEKKISTVNMLGCHDGIPLLDLKGLLPKEEIQSLIDRIVSRGGMVKNLHGQKNLYYQVNATYYSALGESDEKMLLARAIQMFMPGKPQIWYLDLFACRSRGSPPP